MKTLLFWFVTWLLFENTSPLIKILRDSDSKCAGLVCDYSYVTWKEKIEILKANNDLRNKIVDGKYNSVMALSSVNKLEWSDKLATLAQDEANKCPDTKVWTFVDKIGRCEYASTKRSEISSNLSNKNLSFLIEKNRMFDIQTDSNAKLQTLRRASATAIGCGYVLRYYREKFIDHFICLYCYIHRSNDIITYKVNRSCHRDCIYENFTCDHRYSLLCSYDNKDGNIDRKQKANALCPNINLLTGTILFWNFMGNSFLCLLASGFLATTLVLAVASVSYISVKNYGRWRKLIKKDTNADDQRSEKETFSSSPRKPENPTPTSASPATVVVNEHAEKAAVVEEKATARPTALIPTAREFSSENEKFNKTASDFGNKENGESAAEITVHVGSQGATNDNVEPMAKTSRVTRTGVRLNHRNTERQFKSRIDLELDIEAYQLAKKTNYSEMELLNRR